MLSEGSLGESAIRYCAGKTVFPILLFFLRDVLVSILVFCVHSAGNCYLLQADCVLRKRLL